MAKVLYKHWFLMSFMCQQPGVWAPFSIVVGSDEGNLTIPQIQNLKEAHNVPAASVLIAISPLGYMTEKAINGLPEVDPPTVTSAAYRQGMLAAVRVEPNAKGQPINPYGSLGSPQDGVNAQDWQEGFTAARSAQADKTTPVPCLEIPPPTAPQGEVVDGTTKPSNLRGKPLGK